MIGCLVSGCLPTLGVNHLKVHWVRSERPLDNWPLSVTLENNSIPSPLYDLSLTVWQEAAWLGFSSVLSPLWTQDDAELCFIIGGWVKNLVTLPTVDQALRNCSTCAALNYCCKNVVARMLRNTHQTPQRPCLSFTVARNGWQRYWLLKGQNNWEPPSQQDQLGLTPWHLPWWKCACKQTAWHHMKC